MVGQHGGGKEEEWEVVSVCRFHEFKQNLPQGPLPNKQPPRRSSKEHSDVVKEEMLKLKGVGAIKEVFYPKWLANTVVVKKKSGK